MLDLSANALAVAKTNLSKATAIEWIVADVTTWRPKHSYDVWHDRAAFQFLTDPAQQKTYVQALRAAQNVGGVAIIGTFAPNGPLRCSGLAVVRHDAASIAVVFGGGFDLVSEHRHEHMTPGDSIQKFQFSTFRRTA